MRNIHTAIAFLWIIWNDMWDTLKNGPKAITLIKKNWVFVHPAIPIQKYISVNYFIKRKLRLILFQWICFVFGSFLIERFTYNFIWMSRFSECFEKVAVCNNIMSVCYTVFFSSPLSFYSLNFIFMHNNFMKCEKFSTAARRLQRTRTQESMTMLMRCKFLRRNQESEKKNEYTYPSKLLWVHS